MSDLIDTFDLLTITPIDGLRALAHSAPDSPDRVITYQAVTPCGHLVTSTVFIQLVKSSMTGSELTGVTELSEHGDPDQRYAMATFCVYEDPDSPNSMMDGFVKVHGVLQGLDIPAVHALRADAALRSPNR